MAGALRCGVLWNLCWCLLDGKDIALLVCLSLTLVQSEAAIALSYPEPYNQGKFFGEMNVLCHDAFALKDLQAIGYPIASVVRSLEAPSTSA